MVFIRLPQFKEGFRLCICSGFLWVTVFLSTGKNVQKGIMAIFDHLSNKHARILSTLAKSASKSKTVTAGS
jgi:hypothetical protein